MTLVFMLFLLSRSGLARSEESGMYGLGLGQPMLNGWPYSVVLT